MGMNLAIQTEVFSPTEDYRWLGSRHGTDIMDPITLAGDEFMATFTDGIVPSGVVIAKHTSGGNNGLYGPYADDGTTGLDTSAGHLGTTTNVGTGLDIPAPLFWHGEVVVAKLPTGHGLTTAARADVPLIRYV